ncbi:MFS transporter [Serratia rhizosphaerae]|uniref:MFS transporter n=1 Tax=Serratia rhizosphaerae TaxID=2597702 RepID=A0ABX6GP38_9GAMM|nr:MFS transporter [Serratia rhizosphaerae]QHA88056.1 MFS transporter [Serratia rhizosphaerae]
MQNDTTQVRPGINRLLTLAGIPKPLLIGFIGFTIFMIGDGIELGFLASYLNEQGLSSEKIALLFTLYGLTGSISAWLSGALSDGYSPYRVMWVGLIIWIVLDIAFLTFGVSQSNYELMLLFYTLRGFGYPLFAYGFLCWIAAASPAKMMGSAMGWFWFFSTLGLMTLAPLVASVSIPRIGEMNTFWLSIVMVIIGGLLALLGLKEPTGKHPLSNDKTGTAKLLFKSISILWREPKAAMGAVTRMINTASFYGFMPVMPFFYTHQGGFTLPEWLQLLSLVFFSNIIGNLVAGILGDKIGHRTTIIVMGGLLCAVTTPLFYYLPLWYPGNGTLVSINGVLWGIGLAGFVPLSALMPLISPANKGAMIASLSLGAGMSMWFGPLLFTLFQSHIGIEGVCLVFTGLYIISMGLTALLKPNVGESVTALENNTLSEPVRE